MKTMNEFLKEAGECIKESDVSTNTAGSVAGVQGNPTSLVEPIGTSMGGDWRNKFRKFLGPLIARTAKRIKKG